MKNSNGFVTRVTDSFELVTWHKYVDAFVTRVIVTIEFVTRFENFLYVRQIRFNFSHAKWQIRTYSQTLPRIRIGQKCALWIWARKSLKSLFYVIPECFPGQNQIEILLNYALISINKTLSQTSYADYIQILQISSETEFLAPTGMATR